MNKQEFLALLRRELAPLSPTEIEERLSFYGEMIDDRMEEGLTEEEAVRSVGDVSAIVKDTVVEVPLAKVKKQKNTLRPWEIVLLILGAPLWLSLLLALFAVILSVYVSLWAVVISLWAVFASFIGSAVGVLLATPFLLIKGLTLPALALLGCALFLAGASVFLFALSKLSTKGLLLLTKKSTRGFKSLFQRKDGTR